MTTPPDDFRDPALSRLYQDTQSGEPPAAVEAAILAAARDAVRPQPRRRTWWQRLQVPVTLAATVVLGVMLSLTMERHPQESPPAPARAPATAPAAAPAGAPASTAEAVSAAPAPAPGERAPLAKRRSDAAVPASPPPSPAQNQVSEPKAPAATAPPAPAPVTGAPAAKALATPGESEARLRESADSRKEEAAPTSAGMAARSAPPRPPEAWLDEIRRLRQQGQMEQAAQRLQEFRRVFPAYPLPEDLR